jgi:hypothetical protein
MSAADAVSLSQPRQSTGPPLSAALPPRQKMCTRNTDARQFRQSIQVVRMCACGLRRAFLPSARLLLVCCCCWFRLGRRQQGDEEARTRGGGTTTMKHMHGAQRRLETHVLPFEPFQGIASPSDSVRLGKLGTLAESKTT